jgi:hypothetical protein
LGFTCPDGDIIQVVGVVVHAAHGGRHHALEACTGGWVAQAVCAARLVTALRQAPQRMMTAVVVAVSPREAAHQQGVLRFVWRVSVCYSTSSWTHSGCGVLFALLVWRWRAK